MLNQYIVKDVNEAGIVVFKCTLCDLENGVGNNVLNHVESQHFPGTFTYKCDFCEKTYQSKNALSVHVHRNHKK